MLNSAQVLSALYEFEQKESEETKRVLDQYESINNDVFRLTKLWSGNLDDWSKYGHVLLADLDFKNQRKSHFMLDSAYSFTSRFAETTDILKAPIKDLLSICGISIDYDGALESDAITTCLYYCPEVENKFLELLKQVNKIKAGEHDKISVYHDDDNSPIAIRKFKYESSALLLRDVLIDDIPVPAGAYVAIPKASKVEKTGEYKYGKRNQKFTTFMFSDTPYLSPGRLSPWVHDNEVERAIFGVDDSHAAEKKVYDSRRGNSYVNVSLDDFKEAAHKVIELAQF